MTRIEHAARTLDSGWSRVRTAINPNMVANARHELRGGPRRAGVSRFTGLVLGRHYQRRHIYLVLSTSV
jgi:hypothetical protein